MELTDNQYKKSEIGVIPSQWDVISFTNCADLKHGFQFREEHFSKEGVAVTKIGNLKDGAGLQFNDVTYIPKDNYYQFARFTLKKGDVLMALTGATLGKISRVDTDEITLQNYRVGNFINKSNTTKDYIFYLLQSPFITKTTKRLVNEAAQPNLGKRDFDKFLVPLPPTITEQTAITTALSDTDALIGNLEKLIAKKRNIKQGAMQELLTGRKRLAGFNGKWKEKMLSDIAEVRKGHLITEKTAITGDIPVIGGGVAPSYYHNQHNREANTITISASGANAGFIAFHRNPIFASDCSTIEDKLPYDIRFIYYSLQLSQGKIFKLQTGGAQPHVYPEQLKVFKLLFPETKVEQTAIANIISDLDDEIMILEKKLEKYKLIKQGMMQVLLTGKIRLV